MRIAILGADGRMGRALVLAIVAEGREAKLTAATEHEGSAGHRPRCGRRRDGAGPRRAHQGRDAHRRRG